MLPRVQCHGKGDVDLWDTLSELMSKILLAYSTMDTMMNERDERLRQIVIPFCIPKCLGTLF